jgi:myo-inositol-1(or 4)-monophosphatase
MNFSDQQLAEFLTAAEHAAKLGGAKLMEMMGTAKVSEKAPKDLVTEADLASQHAIENYLLEKFPDHVLIGEEDTELSGELDGDGDRCCWVVDPLDGTMNYVHQLRSFSVSIALRQHGQLLVGVVYDPWLDECFSAALGQGATLNGEKIGTSGCAEISEALVVCSFSSSVTREHPEVERFLRVLGNVASIRRLGSAALNLSYVACGRTDAYWATGLKCWDIAAGFLILSESGGTLDCIEGGTEVQFEKPKFCASASETLGQAMRQYVVL